jgi:hypothetical protein
VHFKRAWSAWRRSAADASRVEDVCMRRSPSGLSTSGASACTSPSACAVPPGRALHRDVVRCVSTRTALAQCAATASPGRRLTAGAACAAAQTDANENPKSPPNALLVASAELCEARRPPHGPPRRHPTGLASRRRARPQRRCHLSPLAGSRDTSRAALPARGGRCGLPACACAQRGLGPARVRLGARGVCWHPDTSQSRAHAA